MLRQRRRRINRRCRKIMRSAGTTGADAKRRAGIALMLFVLLRNSITVRVAGRPVHTGHTTQKEYNHGRYDSDEFHRHKINGNPGKRLQRLLLQRCSYVGFDTHWPVRLPLPGQSNGLDFAALIPAEILQFMGNPIYFIAIPASQQINAAMTTFKQDFAARFDSAYALKVFAHITLKAPFSIPGNHHDALLAWFRNMYRPVGPFSIILDGFGSFTGSWVIFAQPRRSTPLIQLQHEILRSFHVHLPGIKIRSLEKKFRPHMTVAYRDLRPDCFAAAWEEYRHKAYHAVFTVAAVGLYRHNGAHWEEMALLHL